MNEKKLKYGEGDEIKIICTSPAWKYYWNKRRLEPHRERVGGFDRKTGALWDGFKDAEAIPLETLLNEHAKSVEIYTDASLNEDNMIASYELGLTFDPEWTLDICSVEKSYDEAGKWFMRASRLGYREAREKVLRNPKLYNPNGEEF